MAVLSKDEVLKGIRSYIGEEPDDERLSYLENLTDTLEDYESRISSNGDWKRKYEENDSEWRRKYTERFFSGEVNVNLPGDGDTLKDPMIGETVMVETEEVSGPTMYEELFKEVE